MASRYSESWAAATEPSGSGSIGSPTRLATSTSSWAWVCARARSVVGPPAAARAWRSAVERKNHSRKPAKTVPTVIVCTPGRSVGGIAGERKGNDRRRRSWAEVEAVAYLLVAELLEVRHDQRGEMARLAALEPRVEEHDLRFVSHQLVAQGTQLLLVGLARVGAQDVVDDAALADGAEAIGLHVKHRRAGGEDPIGRRRVLGDELHDVRRWGLP